jgi:ABC-type Na+ efflux pump permease subunit
MRNLKNGSTNLYNMNKINYTNAIITLIIMIGLYIIYNMFQTEHTKLQHNFKTIDSLTQEIHKVDSLHKAKDSTIAVYKDSIIYLDNVIYDKKDKITKIKLKYDKVLPTITQYTNPQLDSFFTNRYGY